MLLTVPDMASPMSSPTTMALPAKWKRIVVRSLLGGAACGLVLAITLVLFYYYTHHPKGWNKEAIRPLNTKAEPITKLNEQLKDESSRVIFSADLENTTSEDITVPKSVTILQQSKSSHALHGSFLEMDKNIFIPARHRVSISLDASGLCAPNYDPQDLLQQLFSR